LAPCAACLNSAPSLAQGGTFWPGLIIFFFTPPVLAPPLDGALCSRTGCKPLPTALPAIVRLYRLSRPLQAPPKTSADLQSEVSASANQPHPPGLNIPVGATGRAVSGNARAPSPLKSDIPLLRGESYLSVPSVRLSVFFTSGRPEAPRIVTRRCWQPASYVHPCVVLLLLSTALNLSCSIARQYRLYTVYTLAKHVHMFNVTVKLIDIGTRTKVYQSDMSGSNFTAVLLKSLRYTPPPNQTETGSVSRKAFRSETIRATGYIGYRLHKAQINPMFLP
jgi:hypothetical protein